VELQILSFHQQRRTGLSGAPLDRAALSVD
jgi:hypothetical protein